MQRRRPHHRHHSMEADRSKGASRDRQGTAGAAYAAVIKKAVGKFKTSDSLFRPKKNLLWLVGRSHRGNWALAGLCADLRIFFRSLRQVSRQGIPFEPDADFSGIYSCQCHVQR